MNHSDKRHKFEKNSKYLTISIYSLFVILAGSVIFRLIYHWAKTVAAIQSLIDVLSPFLIGLLVAYMLDPIIGFFEQNVWRKMFRIRREKIAKLCAVFVTYIIIFGALGICMNFVIPQILKSIGEITTSIPSAYATIMDRLTNLTKHGQNITRPSMINVIINQSLPKAYTYIEQFMGESIPVLYDFSMQIIKVIFNLFIALIISIYLSLDKKLMIKSLKRFMYALLPVNDARNIISTFQECDHIFSNYLVGKSIDSLIIGILCFVITSIFHLPYSVLISIIVGITNMIPYFGPFLGAIPGVCLIAILSPIGAVKFAIIIFLIQQFDGYILGPRILGNSTGVRPVAILFAVIVGGAYFGVAGMFLGVPILAVIQYLVGEWMEKRLAKKQIQI